MNQEVKEIYTKEGKQLYELIQEWIDENKYFLYCKTINKTDIGSSYESSR